MTRMKNGTKPKIVDHNRHVAIQLIIKVTTIENNYYTGNIRYYIKIARPGYFLTVISTMIIKYRYYTINRLEKVF